MESKSITLESSINFETEGPLNDKQRKIIIDYYKEKYEQAIRTRESARALVEEVGRQQERLVHQTTFAAYFGVARPFDSDAAGRDILCRSQEHREDSEADTKVGAQQNKKNWF